MGNVSDETIQEKLGIVLAARVKLNSAQGEYRAAVKACRAVGLEPADVTWYVASRARDVRDIDAATRRRTRLAAVMGLPIGSQLGLFDDGETAATKAEHEQIAKNNTSLSTEKSIAAAREAGRRHGLEGKSRVDTYADGSPEQLAYDAAWTAAQAELTQRAFGTTHA